MSIFLFLYILSQLVSELFSFCSSYHSLFYDCTIALFLLLHHCFYLAFSRCFIKAVPTSLLIAPGLRTIQFLLLSVSVTFAEYSVSAEYMAEYTARFFGRSHLRSDTNWSAGGPPDVLADDQQTKDIR
jgi:hypothetical protein